jgi:hypothetical protein
MALELKTASSRNQDGSELYIEFRNATGDYDVTTNPGGFGAPNPERSVLAILYYGILRTTEEDIEILPVLYNPLTAESLTIAIDKSKNGHHNFWLFALPIFDDQLTYSIGDIVFNNDDPGNAVVQKLNIDEEWDILSTEDLISEDVIKKEVNNFVTPEADTFVNELNATRLVKLTKLIEGTCQKAEYDDARDAYDYVDGTLEAAYLDFCSGAYAEAQLKLESIFEYQESYNAA